MKKIRVLFEKRTAMAAMLAIMISTAPAARAGNSGYLVKNAKVTKITKRDSLPNLPLESALTNYITVTIANDPSNLRATDKAAAEKVTVTVYALPTKCANLSDGTGPYQFKQGVKSGAITKFDLPLFNCYASESDALNLGVNAAWAKSSQQVSVAPKASKDFVFSFPSAYKIPKSPSGSDYEDKFNSIIKVFATNDGYYRGVPPKILTFDQSVYLILVGDNAVKGSGGQLKIDTPDDAFYLDPRQKK